MKRWLRVFNILALAASAGFIGVFLWQNRAVFSQISWRELMRPMTLGVLLYGVSLGGQAFVWVTTVSEVTETPWSLWDLATYLETHLMRRLPGAPWYIAGRVAKYGARETGKGAQAALTASILEWAGSLATACVWVVGGYWGWVPGLLMGAGVLAAAVGFVHLVRSPVSPRWLRRIEWVSTWQVLRALGVYMVTWPIAASMLHLLLIGIAPQSGLTLSMLSGAWAASAALSMVMAFAPAGLGVRELTLAVQLEHSVGLAQGALVALLMRLVFMLSDVFYLGLIKFLHYWYQRHAFLPD